MSPFFNQYSTTITIKVSKPLTMRVEIFGTVRTYNANNLKKNTGVM